MEYIVPVFWMAIVTGWIVYVVLIKKNRNLRAAQSGEDMDNVRRAVEQLTGGMGDFRLAYAHWIEQESYGRTVKTTYFRFAVTFADQGMQIFPLRIDKKTHQVEAHSPLKLTAANLGKVTVQTKEKEGVLRRVETWLLDKQGKSIIKLYVDAENLRKSRWFPVNILQQEECDAFGRFITGLSRQVAEENPDVEAMLTEEAKEVYGVLGFGLSLGGALGGICFPPMGVFLCLIGLALSVIGKCKGAKSNKHLIISVVCMVWSVVFCWIYFTYFFI